MVISSADAAVDTPTIVIVRQNTRARSLFGRMEITFVAFMAPGASDAALDWKRRQRAAPMIAISPVPSSASDAGSGVGDGETSAGVKSNVKAKSDDADAVKARYATAVAALSIWRR